MQKSKLKILTPNKEINYIVEIPETDKELYKGLSGCKKLAEKSSMLFDFTSKREYAVMSMKNMKFNLDFIFIDNTGCIVKIEHNIKPSTKKLYGCHNTKAALEVNAGDCKKYNINVLDYIKHQIFNNLNIVASQIKKSETKIEFDYSLKDYGWAKARLLIGGQEIVMNQISYHSENEPIYYLLDAIMDMIPLYAMHQWINEDISLQKRISGFVWESEYGQYNCDFIYYYDDMLGIKIEFISNKESKKHASSNTLIDTVVDLKQFVRSIVKAFDILIKKEGFILFQEKWNDYGYMQFPIYEFLKLKFYVLTNKPWHTSNKEKDALRYYNLSESMSKIKEFVKYVNKDEKEYSNGNLTDDIDLLIADI
jgi:uncharacterized membrane protein (UPF0127 family)